MEINPAMPGSQVGPAQDKEKQAKLLQFKKACQQFEAIFLYYMLKTMRSASNKSSLLGDGLGSDMFMQIFDEGLAGKMSQSDQFGIGKILYKQYVDFVSGGKEKDKSLRPEVRPAVRGALKAGENSPRINKINDMDDIINQAASKYDIAPELVKAMIWHESGGNPRAVSAKGAKGLMQLMDGTARMLGVTDPFDVRQNVFGGVKYLAGLLKKFGGDVKRALAAYNAGPATVEKYGGVPPYAETQKYVSTVLDHFNDLFKPGKTR